MTERETGHGIAMSGERHVEFGAPQVPQFDRVVDAGRDDSVGAVREARGQHRVLVFERMQRMSPPPVPHLSSAPHMTLHSHGICLYSTVYYVPIIE